MLKWTRHQSLQHQRQFPLQGRGPLPGVVMWPPAWTASRGAWGPKKNGGRRKCCCLHVNSGMRQPLCPPHTANNNNNNNNWGWCVNVSHAIYCSPQAVPLQPVREASMNTRGGSLVPAAFRLTGVLGTLDSLSRSLPMGNANQALLVWFGSQAIGRQTTWAVDMCSSPDGHLPWIPAPVWWSMQSLLHTATVCQLPDFWSVCFPKATSCMHHTRPLDTRGCSSSSLIPHYNSVRSKSSWAI